MDKDIYAEMRFVMTRDITEYITQILADSIDEAFSATEAQKQLAQAKEALSKATIPQLWRLTRYVQQETKFRILHCTPNDHMAITFAGIYVGIELDGHAHS